MKEDLLETLRAGPGEAARQEVAIGERGPIPSRWTLRTIRASVAWLTEYTLSGVWRVLQTWGLGLHVSCARLFSPDPDYRRKVRRLHHCLRAAARHPATVVALFLDEFGYQRWPEVAPTWGLEAAVATAASEAAVLNVNKHSQAGNARGFSAVDETVSTEWLTREHHSNREES